jgi:hypothetical protein
MSVAVYSRPKRRRSWKKTMTSFSYSCNWECRENFLYGLPSDKLSIRSTTVASNNSICVHFSSVLKKKYIPSILDANKKCLKISQLSLKFCIFLQPAVSNFCSFWVWVCDLSKISKVRNWFSMGKRLLPVSSSEGAGDAWSRCRNRPSGSTRRTAAGARQRRWSCGRWRSPVNND